MIYYTSSSGPGAVITCYLNRTTELTAEFGSLMALMLREAYGGGIPITRHEIFSMECKDGNIVDLTYNFYDPNSVRFEKTLECLKEFPGVLPLLLK